MYWFFFAFSYENWQIWWVNRHPVSLRSGQICFSMVFHAILRQLSNYRFCAISSRELFVCSIFHVFCNNDVVSVFLALASLAPTLLSRSVSDIFRFSTIWVHAPPLQWLLWGEGCVLVDIENLDKEAENSLVLKTSQEMRMLSRSLSDCKSLLLNVMI